MSASPTKDPILADHLAWLGYVQPEGLVVSAPALKDAQAVINRAELGNLQRRFAEHVTSLALGDSDTADVAAGVGDLPRFFTEFLGWPADLLAGWDTARPLPPELSVSLPEFGETLVPTYAVVQPLPKEGAPPWLLLIQAHSATVELDKPVAGSDRGWHASPAKKFERLLRETHVPIGLLTNGVSFRLVYAPPKENSGALTFPVQAMTEVSGRLILGAFHLLLNSFTLFNATSDARLPALLQRSRDYQASVSEKLAEQVLHALYELLRGFEAADAQAKTELVRTIAAKHPENVYGGLVTVLLRLVFVLFAEDRGLLPLGGLYVRHYSVRGLFERLRADAERHPDTMDLRYGAWAQLLALFRLIHDGCEHPELGMPAREGHLFDPDRYPFLEGRAHHADPVAALPLVSDGVLHRILENLCILDGERVSYRTLDVEEIGSVYQTIMGFGIEVVAGVAVAFKGKRKKGAVPAAPVLDLEFLLSLNAVDRLKHLVEEADIKLSGEVERRVKEAATVDDLLAALEKRIDRNSTPSPLSRGDLALQPNDERRRSGSHYTPRSFTAPIVRKTLEPVLARLINSGAGNSSPTPTQILELKVADIAVGSAAFLVEVCRQLGDSLARAWRLHGGRPPVPPDETEELFAMRLVAQRCLYGVDRNPMAVDLAKLSLWLATLAKDHPFTFLDHNIRCGDSLVGLAQEQIEAFSWEEKIVGKQRILGQHFLEKRIKAATSYRREILEGGDYVLPSLKAQKLRLADEALDEVRFAGDLVISAFFAANKDKARKEKLDELREAYVACHASSSFDPSRKPVGAVEALRAGSKAVWPFHWQIEFPEVFGREHPGFDLVVGNPPFLGGVRVSNVLGMQVFEFLTTAYPGAGHLCDLVAYFFRRAFALLRSAGAMGLVATNSIAQGDTRNGGLAWICNHGGQIFSATRRQKWPGQAAVVVSLIHITKDAAWSAPVLDGRVVPTISAYLFTSGGNDDPVRLAGLNALFSQGTNIRSPGFLIGNDGEATTLAEMEELLRVSPKSRSRILPHIGGEQINSDPAQRPKRFVVYLSDIREEHGLDEWPELTAIVRKHVKPERDALGLNPNNIPLKRRWWAYHADRLKFLEGLPRALVMSQVSAHLAFTFQPTNRVYGHVLNLFRIASDGGFCVLQSRLHEVWARFFSSSLEDRLRYTPSDCFETFPFPRNFEADPRLEVAGKNYSDFRAELMVRNNEGLTATYNRFHDQEDVSPDIMKLRDLHAEMDRAVLEVYEWTDIPTSCEFLPDYIEESVDGEAVSKSIRYRWPDDVRDEVLARLLKLNAERAEQERLAGAASAPKPATKKVGVGSKRGRKKADEPPVALPPSAARQLPTDLRLPENDAGLYAMGLIVALLSESGGTLPWPKLLDSFTLATQPKVLLNLAPPEFEAAASQWSAQWSEKTTPHDLLPALRKLGGGNLSVDKSLLGFEVSLQDGPRKMPAHVAYDAWLALSVAETLNSSAALISPSQREVLTAELAALVV